MDLSELTRGRGGPGPEVSREETLMAVEVERMGRALKHYNDELKLMDEHLSVVMAKGTTSVEGLKPGYYHLVRENPGHLAYIKPIEGPNGEWRDLDSSIFDLAAEDDLWNDRAQSIRKEKREAARAAHERQVARERADRAREFDERWKARNNVSASIPKSIQ